MPCNAYEFWMDTEFILPLVPSGRLPEAIKWELPSFEKDLLDNLWAIRILLGVFSSVFYDRCLFYRFWTLNLLLVRWFIYGHVNFLWISFESLWKSVKVFRNGCVLKENLSEWSCVGFTLNHSDYPNHETSPIGSWPKFELNASKVSLN